MTKDEFIQKYIGINMQLGFIEFAHKRRLIDQKIYIDYLLKFKTELEILKLNKPF
jgi:hypothetical protein